MKLTCDEATKICDKNQYGEASLWEKIKLNFHMMFCKVCGLYSKQNTVMTKCYEKHKDIYDKKKCLAPEEKEIMEKELEEVM